MLHCISRKIQDFILKNVRDTLSIHILYILNIIMKYNALHQTGQASYIKIHNIHM